MPCRSRWLRATGWCISIPHCWRVVARHTPRRSRWERSIMTNLSRSSSPPTSSSLGDLAGESTAHATGALSSIDLSGELCPFTFVRTKLALEELPIGGLLRVIVDHEPATRNVPRSAAEWGQEVLGVTRLTAHTWAIDLRKRVR